MEATLKLHAIKQIPSCEARLNSIKRSATVAQNDYVNPRWRLRASHVLLHVFHAVNILFPAISSLMLKDMKELAAVMYPDFNLCSSLSAINLRQNLCRLPWRGEIATSTCSYITYDGIELQLSNSSGNFTFEALESLFECCHAVKKYCRKRLGGLVSKFKGSEVNLSTTV